jgi:hypothetical protein
MVREMAAETLRDEGFDVLEAASGDEAAGKLVDTDAICPAEWTASTLLCALAKPNPVSPLLLSQVMPSTFGNASSSLIRRQCS